MDYKFITFLEQQSVPYQVVMTKIDKLKTADALTRSVERLRTQLVELQSMNLIPYFHVTSATKHKKRAMIGIDSLRYSVLQAHHPELFDFN